MGVLGRGVTWGVRLGKAYLGRGYRGGDLWGFLLGRDIWRGGEGGIAGRWDSCGGIWEEEFGKGDFGGGGGGGRGMGGGLPGEVPRRGEVSGRDLG